MSSLRSWCPQSTYPKIWKDVDLKSCFVNTRPQEETSKKEIAMYILSQFATAADTTETTGKSTVDSTTYAQIASAIPAPGPTNISASHQDAADHTPSQTVRFDKTAVETKAVIRVTVKITYNTGEKTTIYLMRDS